MTHVWQKQSGESVIGRGIFERDYSYDLGSGTAFDDYDLEAQGNIIMDYYLTSKGQSTRQWGSQTKTQPEPLSSYQKVLKEFIANPSYLKQRNEQRLEEFLQDDY